MAASPGGLGGIRGLPMLRLLLSNIGMNVVGSQYGLSPACGFGVFKPRQGWSKAALEQQVRKFSDLAKKPDKNLHFFFETSSKSVIMISILEEASKEIRENGFGFRG